MPLMPMPPMPTKWIWVSRLRKIMWRREGEHTGSAGVGSSLEAGLRLARERLSPISTRRSDVRPDAIAPGVTSRARMIGGIDENHDHRGPQIAYNRSRMSARETALALTRWFAAAQRDLPWRKTRDPYAIWVSEVMLQQTRVDTVEGYYDGFLRRFPDVESLAAADEDAVLSAWSGLGYYRRARLLHRGARHVVEALNGELPADAVDLRRIPGIGPYTAGAIASIAFDRPEPLVDGNVARVLSRFHAIEDPAGQDAKARRHWDEVAEIVQHGRPRVLTQALMELGATVCTPQRPRCEDCPLQPRCRAHALGRAADIMVTRRKASVRTERYHALLLRCGDRVLLAKRPEGGLLAGLWCPPLVPRQGRRRLPTAAAVEQLLGAGVDVRGAASRDVKHVFTHRIWHLTPCVGGWPRRPRLALEGAAWVPLGGLPVGGVPTVTKKLLGVLEDDGQ
ncbi:MAG: A/G-specific adenine glycosylase [Myxococcales bacterium FL481]|nr:MAG: A/G-specific adenine glycosylase [Myxococcales bacterium FL481]